MPGVAPITLTGALAQRREVGGAGEAHAQCRTGGAVAASRFMLPADREILYTWILFLDELVHVDSILYRLHVDIAVHTQCKFPPRAPPRSTLQH